MTLCCRWTHSLHYHHNLCRICRLFGTSAKILGSVFGILVVYGAFYWQMAYVGYRETVANGLSEMAANGATLSAGATQFVANFSTASASGTTGILLIVFDLTILGMILGSIWMAKK